MKDKLITLLEAQIAGVLPKIVEDEEADDWLDKKDFEYIYLA